MTRDARPSLARLGELLASARGTRPSTSNGSGAGPPAGATAVGPRDLAERHARLCRALAELQWDLGGLTYEMAIRDHFRLDVLTRAAAELQAVDAELAEVERMLALEDAGAAGSCSGCGALHSRGAAFCWRCGGRLMADSPGDAPTEVLANH